MGIRESRKKLQRSVIYIAQCEKAESALHELTLLKQTVDSQVQLLGSKLNLLEECTGAAHIKTEDEINVQLNEAAEQEVPVG